MQTASAKRGTAGTHKTTQSRRHRAGKASQRSKEQWATGFPARAEIGACVMVPASSPAKEIRAGARNGRTGRAHELSTRLRPRAERARVGHEDERRNQKPASPEEKVRTRDIGNTKRSHTVARLLTRKNKYKLVGGQKEQKSPRLQQHNNNSCAAQGASRNSNSYRHHGFWLTTAQLPTYIHTYIHTYICMYV